MPRISKTAFLSTFYPLLSTLIVFLFLSFLSPTPARAVSVGVCPDGSTDCATKNYQWSCIPEGKPGHVDNCVSYISEIYKYSLRLGATLAVLMIIYAGYLYVFSQGDTSKLTQAKEILVGTLLGFLLLLIIGLILDFIGLPGLGAPHIN